MQVTTIGLDLAKRVFQAHGVDAAGRTVLRRKLQWGEVLAFFRDLPPCLVGSRPAAQHIIGRARSGHSAMRCG